MQKLDFKIIGLTGLAGHGKTEVAEMLAKETGYTRIAFADAVKRAAAGMYDLHIHTFYEGGVLTENFNRNTTVIEPYGITVRTMMQQVGDAMKNTCGGDFWINLTKCEMIRLSELSNIKGFIVEDIRYDANNPWGEAGSEYDSIRSWGGKILHVDAMERVGIKDVHKSHTSEKGVNRLDGDAIIDNNGTLERLQATVEAVAKTL